MNKKDKDLMTLVNELHLQLTEKYGGDSKRMYFAAMGIIGGLLDENYTLHDANNLIRELLKEYQ